MSLGVTGRRLALVSLAAIAASLSACGGGASSTGDGGSGGSGSGGAARGGTGGSAGAPGGRGGGGGSGGASDGGAGSGGDAATGTGGSGGSSGASGSGGTAGGAGSGGTVGTGGARGGTGGGAGSGVGGGTGGGGSGGGAGASTGGTTGAGGSAGTGGGGSSGRGGGGGTAGSGGTGGTGGSGGASGSGGGSGGAAGNAGAGGSAGTAGGAGTSGASGTGGGAGTSGASGTSGVAGAGGTAGTGGGAGTGGSGGLSCTQCAAVVFACGADAVCARCMDGESAACVGNTAYADALSCLCGQSARCARVDTCLPAPPAPRLIGPVTANNQGPRPNLRWKTHPAADTSRILICRDRACGVPVAELTDPVGATPASNLAPGTYYWVGVGRRQLPGGTWIEGTVSSVTWQFVVGHGTASPLIGYGSLPDFDGDGRGDIGITNSSDTDYYGTSTLDKSASIFRIHPNTSGPVREQKFYTAGSVYFATQFRNVGDVNGDGYADAVTRTDSMTVGSPANVTLYNGGPNGLVPGASRQIGIVSYVLPALEWVGDVNGDGYADVGALTTDQSHYFLVLIRGGPNGLEAPDAAIDVGEWALYYDTIHGLGDVNGDGFADVEVNNFGQVKVFLGSATGLPSTPSYFFDGRYRGYPLGDVNDDGRADLLVEQVERVQSGIITTPQKAFLVLGGATLAIDAAKVLNYPQYAPKSSDPCYQPKTYPCTYDMTGPFSAVGDLNGDGYADVMLAGKVLQDPLRRVDIYFGSASGLGPSAGQELTNPDDTQPLSDYNFGWTISGLGDVNGDAFDDVAIGAYQGGSPLIPPRIAPKVRIYAGAASGPTAAPTWTIISTQRTNLNDSFGSAICGIGG